MEWLQKTKCRLEGPKKGKKEESENGHREKMDGTYPKEQLGQWEEKEEKEAKEEKGASRVDKQDISQENAHKKAKEKENHTKEEKVCMEEEKEATEAAAREKRPKEMEKEKGDTAECRNLAAAGGVEETTSRANAQKEAAKVQERYRKKQEHGTRNNGRKRR